MTVTLDDAFFELDDYKLVGDPVGEGSYGKVYIVEKKSDKKTYAAKIASAKSVEKGKGQRLFMRETMLMKMMKHPAIVRFYGLNFNSFSNHDLFQPTIIMEYLKNGSLEKILIDETKGLSNHEWTMHKKYISLLGVAHAMNYLHQHNILHRDLKPGNILMDDDFYPRVSDFGLSRTLGDNQAIDLSKTAGVGTPKYMAPELLQGEKRYTFSVDVYAYGMMAYEIVTGTEPYSKPKVPLTYKILYDNVTKGIKPTFTDDIHQGLRLLIEDCLSLNPMERPTFEEVYDKLSKNLEFSGIQEDDLDEVKEYIEKLEDPENYDTVKSSESAQNEDEVGEKIIEISSSINPNSSTIQLSNSSILGSLSGSRNIFVLDQKDADKKLQKERQSYVDVIKRFIPKITHINLKDKKGNTYLHQVCQTGDIGLVKTFLEKESIDITAKNNAGQNILHNAVQSENLELLKYLISLDKLEVQNKDENKATLLHYAAELGNLEMVKYLISLDKIELTAKDSNERSVLHYACKSGNKDLVEYLISLGKLDVKAKDKDKTSILHYGCQSGNLQLVKYLIDLKQLKLTSKIGRIACILPVKKNPCLLLNTSFLSKKLMSLQKTLKKKMFCIMLANLKRQKSPNSLLVLIN